MARENLESIEAADPAYCRDGDPVILGDGVLLFDPLLEGLGLTLMSGALIATLLTLLLVPVLYHHLMSASARGAAWLQAVRADQRE